MSIFSSALIAIGISWASGIYPAQISPEVLAVLTGDFRGFIQFLRASSDYIAYSEGIYIRMRVEKEVPAACSRAVTQNSHGKTQENSESLCNHNWVWSRLHLLS
jgi:hypothetical protein